MRLGLSSIGSANSDPIEMTIVYSGTSLVHSDGDACRRCRVTLVVDLNVDSAVVVILERNAIDE